MREAYREEDAQKTEEFIKALIIIARFLDKAKKNTQTKRKVERCK